MESVTVHLDDGTYDRVLEESRKADTPQAGPLTIATKKKALTSGRTGVVLSFETMIEGKKHPVQAVITKKLLVNAVRAIEAAE